MSARDLAKRLALAEAVCLMYGWSPVHDVELHVTRKDGLTLEFEARTHSCKSASVPPE